MAKIRVRRAKPEELMDIADIVLDSFVSEINGNIKELEGTDVTNRDKFYNSYVKRALSKTPFVIFIAEINDKIIGVAGGSVTMHHWGKKSIEAVKLELCYLTN